MRHRDISTTMTYTHVLNKPGLGVKSPLDREEPVVVQVTGERRLGARSVERWMAITSDFSCRFAE